MSSKEPESFTLKTLIAKSEAIRTVRNQEWQEIVEATIAENAAQLKNPALQEWYKAPALEEWQKAYLRSDRVIDKLFMGQLTIEHAIKETSVKAIRKTLPPDQIIETPPNKYGAFTRETLREPIPEFLKKAIQLGYSPRELGYVTRPMREMVYGSQEGSRNPWTWFTEEKLQALQAGKTLEEIRVLDAGLITDQGLRGEHDRRDRYDVDRISDYSMEPGDEPGEKFLDPMLRELLEIGFSEQDLTEPWMSPRIHQDAVETKILTAAQARGLNAQQVLAIVDFGVPRETVLEYPSLTLEDLDAMTLGFSFDELKEKPWLKTGSASQEAKGTLTWQHSADSMEGGSSSKNPGWTKTEHPKAKP